jgi:PhoPQ-activated pathogenicity-related protein
VSRKSAAFTAALLVAFLPLLPACAGAPRPRPQGRSEPTPLDLYVAAPDPAYRWEPVTDLQGEGCTAHVLKMTSQTWLTPDDVDRTTWWHWLTIVEPERITNDLALLYIHSGINDDPAPSEIRAIYARIARATGSVVAELRMVPNQPLRFKGDADGPRREDRLIAFGWRQFLRGGDPVWLPRLPMTKSAVRAMDTVSAFFDKRGGQGAPRVRRFVVVGASKRGWTTWTTAAVDPRVVGIIPIVIDLLNLEASFEHHFKVYGFWAPAIQSYVEMGIPDWFGTPEMRRLREIEDPYSYRARLTMPKLLINATGDQFFVPDSSRLYYDDLPGEKHLRYVPNADHSMRETDVDESVLSFFGEMVTGSPRPEISWAFDPDGSIRVRASGAIAPTRVLQWEATNPKARDFRVETIGASWRSTVLAREPDGGYIGRVTPAASGWTAFFVELTYPGVDGASLKLTTQVRVLPDTYKAIQKGG